MTFNIQHSLDYKNQVVDPALFADAIRLYGADVCGLNEVRCGDGAHTDYTDQARDIGDALGFYHYFAKATHFVGNDEIYAYDYGNALVSRYPIKEAVTIPIPNTEDRSEPTYYETRCAIKAVLDVDGTDICFLVCHMGLAKSERREAVAVLCRLLDEITMPVVLMGDFNDVPTSPVLQPLFERLQDAGALGEEASLSTFRSYDPQEKIDYIFYRGLACTKSTVITQVVSDHFPIIADMSLYD